MCGGDEALAAQNDNKLLNCHKVLVGYSQLTRTLLRHRCKQVIPCAYAWMSLTGMIDLFDVVCEVCHSHYGPDYIWKWIPLYSMCFG